KGPLRSTFVRHRYGVAVPVRLARPQHSAGTSVVTVAGKTAVFVGALVPPRRQPFPHPTATIRPQPEHRRLVLAGSTAITRLPAGWLVGQTWIQQLAQQVL